MSVKDKIVVITGAASGIGLAGARRLARDGATVVLVDRNLRAAEAAAADIQSNGGKAAAMALDIGDGPATRACVEQIASRHGRIDALVHSAGICPRKPFLEMTDEDWREIMRINLDGTFYVTQAVAQVMIPRRSGTMLLVTSDRGVYGSIDYAHYASTKGGMIALTKSLALILGPKGITVNGLNPGLTDTPLGRTANPDWEGKRKIDVLGRTSKPEEIAEIILFAIGTAGGFMTGQIISNRMRFGM